MTRRKRASEVGAASPFESVKKTVKKTAAKAAHVTAKAAGATAKAAKAAVKAVAENVVEPVEKALGLTPPKPKVKKERKRHVRPPKRTPAAKLPEREPPKTVKAKTLTHSVAKTLHKPSAKPQPGPK